MRRYVTAFFWICAGLSLGACSSGDGGGSPMPQEPMRSSVLKKMQDIQKTGDEELVGDIVFTATRRPRGLNSNSLKVASITQGSGSTDGVTNTRLSFVNEYDADGTPHFTVRALTRTGSTSTLSTKNPRASFDRVRGPRDGWKGVELQEEGSSSRHYTELFSDIEDAADTDYLTFGYWLRESKEKSPSPASNYSLLIGAGGNDPFETDKLAGLTATATYEGPATGLHMKKDTATAAPVFDYFAATARLTADFGNATALGTVSGDNLRGHDGRRQRPA